MADNVVLNGLERQLNFNSGGLDGITNDQTAAEVAALSGGGYIVAYESFNGADFDVYAQRLDANGAPIGDNLGLSYGGDQVAPSLAGRADDGFVLVYQG